ncbi:MAG: ABC transporter permease [Steroidobacteraceae bacterium]|jgi:ABC-2 type transport system permease protein|nr:ABC transporter permease [Steroidobacteraceae bacterium]
MAAERRTPSLRRIAAVATKEVRQLARDRLTGGMVLGLPVVQMLLFGYAINFDVRGLDTAVLDQASSSVSRQLLDELQATQVLQLVERVGSERELESRLREGRVAVGVVVPPDVERRLQESTRPVAQLLVDGSQPTLSSVVGTLGAMPLLLRHGARGERGERGREAARRLEVRTLYNPEKRTAVQIVPALIGVILSMTMVLFTAGAIVRERERGNLELLIATPLTPLELMVGKLLPFVVVGLVQASVILLVGHLLFRVPVAGRFVDLYLASLLFIAATLSLGLFVSTLAQTQFQAFQLAFLTMLPSILLSGFMFPFEGMPVVAQRLAEILPLTHFNVMIRGIVLRGATLGDVWPQVAKLAAFFAIMMIVAVARFRKRLD